MFDNISISGIASSYNRTSKSHRLRIPHIKIDISLQNKINKITSIILKAWPSLREELIKQTAEVIRAWSSNCGMVSIQWTDSYLMQMGLKSRKFSKETYFGKTWRKSWISLLFSSYIANLVNQDANHIPLILQRGGGDLDQACFLLDLKGERLV